jgi:hypothetical protein
LKLLGRMGGQSASLALHQNPQPGSGSLRILKSMGSVAEVEARPHSATDRGVELKIAGNGVLGIVTSGKVPTLGGGKTRFRESWEKSCPAQIGAKRAGTQLTARALGDWARNGRRRSRIGL